MKQGETQDPEQLSLFFFVTKNEICETKLTTYKIILNYMMFILKNEFQKLILQTFKKTSKATLHKF